MTLDEFETQLVVNRQEGNRLVMINGDMCAKVIKLAKAAQVQRQYLLTCALEDYILAGFGMLVDEVFRGE